MSWPNLSDLIVRRRCATRRSGWSGRRSALGSVTPGRCDLAPALLRATLRRIGRYDVDTGRELASRIADHGDAAIDGLSIEEATGPIREACAASVARACADAGGRRE